MKGWLCFATLPQGMVQVMVTEKSSIRKEEEKNVEAEARDPRFF